MEKYNRNSIFTELKEYCYISDEHSFIEVTEWYNGEGFDVEICSKQREKFSLTWGEFKALKKLIKELNK